MEKLIELLNEYCGEDEGSETKWTKKHLLKGGLLSLQVISNQFGFIKWLVENEKIDTDIVYKKGFLAKTYDKDEVGEYFEPYEEILMLLSIQDEPIKFLISILK